jgi:SAM-dependent methyltransferase
MKINLGCGRKKLEGFLNLDRVPEVDPDVIHDLDSTPYPFEEGVFDLICAHDVVEHVHDLPAFMREVWRIGKHGACLEVTTPHFSCHNSYTDPTHQRHLGYFSFDYFTLGHKWSFYGSTGFTIDYRTFVFSPNLLNRIVSRLANRFPDRYEARWAWIFPAWYLFFKMKIDKTS